MISEELKRIKEAKDALKVSINNKGVTVTDADSISVYASKVDLIVTGTSREMQSINITENGKYENTSIPYSSVTVNVDDGSERIRELEDEIIDLNSQITQKQNKIDELQNKLDYDEGLIEDLRNEITSLESQKTALQNELNELKSKVNSMTDLNVTTNGTYKPTFGYKSVTVNVPQTGASEMQSLEVINLGLYENTSIPYSSVSVSDKYFYKKYTDGEGNTYIRNEKGEVIITYRKDTPPTPEIPSDEIWYYTTDGLTAQTTNDYGKENLKKMGLISNTYVDGKGIMKFSKDVTTIETSTFSDCDAITEVQMPHSVTYIGTCAFEECIGLTSITIPSSVTEISTNALRACSSLSSIIVEEGNTNYDSRNNCNAVIETSTNKLLYGCKNTVIPNTVTTLGDLSFDSCTGLTSITIPDSVTSIGSAFRGCSNLTNIIIPDSVTYLGRSAFSSCSGLTSATIGNSVTYINSFAFNNCRSMTSVTIGNSVTTIDERAFANCYKLTGVTIPDSVTRIDYMAFSACSGLTSVTIPDSVIGIGYYAFDFVPTQGTLYCYKDWYDNLTSEQIQNLGNVYNWNKVYLDPPTDEYGYIKFFITGDDTLTTMNSNSHMELADIEEMYLDDKDVFTKSETLGRWTLENYPITNNTYYTVKFKLRDSEDWLNMARTANFQLYSNGERSTKGTIQPVEIKLQNGVITISYDGSTNKPILNQINYKYITKVILPPSVKEIGYYAFGDYERLVDINIPEGVEIVSHGAFRNCYVLNNVVLPSTVVAIGNYAFSNCSGLTKVENLENATSIGSVAFNKCFSLTSVTIGNSVTKIGSDTFRYCSGLTSVTIGNSVTSIGTNAFDNCTSLTSIVLPDSLTTIDNYAFYQCLKLTKLTIPNTVTQIGKYAICGCIALKNITIPNKVTTIEEGTFRYCTSLTSVTIPNSVTSIGNYTFYDCSGLTSVTIGNSVTSIGESAFHTCTNLTSVTMPNSVTSIGFSGFWDCTKLARINYNGTKEQFSSMKKSLGWSTNVPNTCIIRCTDGSYPITDFVGLI